MLPLNSPDMPRSTAILTDFMLPPVAAAFATLLLGLSLALIADAAGIRIFSRRDKLSRALYFFAGLLALSWIVLLLAVTGLASQAILGVISGSIFMSGTVAAWRRRRELMAFARRFRGQRGSIWLMMFAIVLLLMALSPPTDADSLDYHLGVPLQALRTGSLNFDPLQLHFQMFGFGEILNLLGLATGCAAFGAFLQLLALGWLLAAYQEIIPENRRIHAVMLVFGIPALIALLPGAKHLLTGACCTAAAFLFLYKNGRQIRGRGLLLPLLAILFAAGIKYSFLISGGLLCVYGIWRGRRAIFPEICYASGIAMLACGPLFLFKLQHFGDPVAPFLHGALGADPVAAWFCGFIRTYTESAFVFPFSVIMPSHMGAISSVLGWGFIILSLFCIVLFRAFKAEAALLLGLCALTLLLGQATSRFFIEPYLWALPLFIVGMEQHTWGKAVLRIGQAQFFVTLPLSLFLAWSLGRGIFSARLQESVMRRNASFYEAAEWVNAVVPPDALLRTDIRSRSLLGMPSFPIEYHYARNAGPQELRTVDSLLQQRYRVQYIAVIDPDEWFVQKYCGALIAGPKRFENATRNPANRGTYTMVIYKAKSPGM